MMTTEMRSRATVGVLGGMGPEATLDFMARVLRATPAASEQDHLRLLVDSDPSMPDRHAAIAGRTPSIGPRLAAMAAGLERAGADFLVMPCNTAHAFQADIEASVGIPFVGMIDLVVDALQSLGASRVGLMAASGCLEAGIYQRALSVAGVQPLVWTTADVAAFMALLYRIKSGERSASLREQLTALAVRLEAAGAEVLVVACTEIPLVLADHDCSVQLLSATDLLATETVRRALGPDLSNSVSP